MEAFLKFYERIQPTTWAYLSSLLTLALYFKFNRIWSLRNVDLILLILLAPGLVLVDPSSSQSPHIQMVAYLWLFSVGGILLVRMLLDSMFVRRPLLDPNLNIGGMIFLSVMLLLFLTAKIISSKPEAEIIAAVPQKQIDMAAAAQSDVPPKALNNTGEKRDADKPPANDPAQPPAPVANPLSRVGPGMQLIFKMVPDLVTPIFRSDKDDEPGGVVESQSYAATYTLAIIAHIAIVGGIILIGHYHFNNLNTGIGAALLYLLLPYTNFYIGRVSHVLPAALLTWAVVSYRRPMIAGVLLGLASGTVYYPIFLLPLWISFYWQRGLWRFITGVLVAIAVLSLAQAFYVESFAEFVNNIRYMLGIIGPSETPQGFWSLLSPNFRVYRLPVLVAHILLAGSFALWPVQKNMGTLMSCSAAIMISAQFWASYGGGISVAWYLPLLLLAIFRPNLEDRVALSVLGSGWISGRRGPADEVVRAA